MTEFKFSCPTCGQHIQGDLRYAGTEIRCPTCKSGFTVPNPKTTTSLRVEHDRWVPPPAHAHSAPTAGARRVSVPPPPPPPPPPAALPPAPPKTSGLAIASLALSVTSLLIGPLGFIPGIICGHIAKAKIAKNPNLGGKGLALAGMIIGYIFAGLFILIIISLTVVARKIRAGMPH